MAAGVGAAWRVFAKIQPPYNKTVHHCRGRPQNLKKSSSPIYDNILLYCTACRIACDRRSRHLNLALSASLSLSSSYAHIRAQLIFIPQTANHGHRLSRNLTVPVRTQKQHLVLVKAVVERLVSSSVCRKKHKPVIPVIFSNTAVGQEQLRPTLYR